MGLKTADEIYAELLAAFAQRAGYTPEDTCELSLRLYAAAAELQALHIQADWVLQQSFPQTAEGQYLDYLAQERGLSRTGAVQAAGTLRFSVAAAPAADLNVEAGTVCMTADEVRFETTQAVILAAGSLYVDAPARAAEAGSAGNALAGTITILTACPAGVTGCTNPAAFSGGADSEDDDSLRTRLLASFQRLPNGANAAFYEETAMAHEGVAAATAIGRARGIGTVDVYVASPGGAPAPALLEELRSELAAKREIAVDVQVLAPTERTVDVSAELAVEEGTDFAAVSEAAERAVRSYFTGKLLGEAVLTAKLGSVLYGVEGVRNYHLLAPAADTAADSAVLPVLGTLHITQIGEA